MIHYLLLLRPVTFQYEPPPPPISLYHYPHYYQQQHPKVNPTKPQKPHYQQRKQETQYSRLIVEQPSSSQSHVKNRASSYGTLQKCNCLNSVSAASTRANKQAAAGNSLYSYSTRKNQSNQWKASTISEQEQQQHQLTSNKIGSKKGKESQSLPTSNRTTESATSARKLQSLSNQDKVESVTLQQTSQSSLPSKIRSIFHFQRRKRYSYSVSPRKILSSLKKLNFSRHTEFKKKVLQEDIVEDDVKEVATRKNFTKQIPTSESNHHQREKEKGKWKGRSLLSANCSSESNKSNITVVVETNKLVKRSITVKSSTTISSPSKPTTEKELDCCVVKSLNSLNTTGASVEEADQEQKKYSSCRPHEEEDDEENGNCSNINNNKRKNSSKNFEKLKKFLLFCKGLRKKSK